MKGTGNVGNHEDQYRVLQLKPGQGPKPIWRPTPFLMFSLFFPMTCHVSQRQALYFAKCEVEYTLSISGTPMHLISRKKLREAWDEKPES